ncbi:MAG: adenosylcobalamin-dependent ribonucleoside-diphosphate reductase, partial [Rhodocyclaceae bacterium]|nr:adenosylcobalamin-dependent ribonucleoside-diphosphate reductase [Rhodocyclaceae bacterium]
LQTLVAKYGHGGETTPQEILARVARGLAQREADPAVWARRFEEALQDCILGGRINASAGVPEMKTTWVNCFVQPLADSVFEEVDGAPGIMEAARQAAQTMRLGGGVGYDFSPIRPKGAWIRKTQSEASGPISYMGIFNAMCETVISAGARRGAQMGILRCDHPDIEEFIVCKRVDDPNMPWDKRPFKNFNLSVGVTDELMRAVQADGWFDLVHEAEPCPRLKEQGAYQRADGRWVYKKVRARDLYDAIIRGTYDRAEPGVVFLDRINSDNNLRYVERIAATNPCGEQPLPPYGCCDLGHVNLTKFVKRTVWQGKPEFDFERLRQVVPVLVRMLDNVLDLTPWPLPQQQAEAQAKRRIGVGLTGLGDTLIMLGLKYSSAQGRDFAKQVMEQIRDAAYLASVELAQERGAFPLFDAERYLEDGTFASRLPEPLKASIRKHGIRNSHLLSLAPTGTGSLTFGNNCSSGCEPVFDWVQTRWIRQPDGSRKQVELADYAWLVYRTLGGDTEHLPDYFESAQDLSVDAHLRMLETLAPLVDAAISKTVNVPADYPFEDFKAVYMRAWEAGLKGITTYRPNSEIGAVLVSSKDAQKASRDAQKEEFDSSDPDRRLRLQALPEKVDKALRWLDRPYIPDGNPAYSYRVESPYGDFSVMIGHYVDAGGTQPFEVWVNGSEAPRGLGAVAKTLSADMRALDREWLTIKLDALAKTNGQAFDLAMPPSGQPRRVPSPAAALAVLLRYHADKIGWLAGQCDDGHKLVDAMLFRKEPKSTEIGTLSWTVDISNPATGDDFALFLKELEMPDGSRRPYSMWLAGSYPKALDGLCKLLSIDMRIADVGWIGMKLRKLLSYKEPQGDFFARVPGQQRSMSYPSTVAYIAALTLYRYQVLGLLDADGRPLGQTSVQADDHKSRACSEKPCPECGSHTLIKYNGCEKCTSCGYVGSCG